jgi:hypothetical protein
MEYIDTLKKYMSGKDYANKAIRSADGAIAYVTASGVSKHYTSMDDYNATAGKNNCPADFIQLTPNWGDLGFAVGSTMKSGQSCGNENAFVQAEPPETNFDWKFYLENNGDLPAAGLTTEQQANDHWNNNGKFEGRIPNATIMSSMATLGKVGYVDVDAQFHKVPSAPSGAYKEFISRSNVTGSKMEDCSKPTPLLRYGEPIVFTQNSQTGSLDTSVFTFGKNSTSFFFRPPPGEDRQGQVIRYGDSVCITSSTSSYTSDCGWWGCKVATMNTSTNQMEFGPGGDSTTTFQLIPPNGSIYAIGSDIKYGYPFSIMTIITSNAANLQKGVSIGCKPGTQPDGMPSGVYRYSGNNTIQYYPTPEIASSWNPDWGNTTEINCSTYKLGETATKLNAASLRNGATVGCISGKELPNGVQGGIYRYVDDNVLRWYPNPDIANAWNRKWARRIKWTDCTTYKAGQPMTAKMDSAPEQEPIPKFAYVSNGIVIFGSWSESKGSNVFSIQYTEIDKSCNIDKMKQSCTDDCVGFVHSPTNHTWQKIKTTSTPGDYKITNTLQDVYVKEMSVDLKDASCEFKKSTFIDPTLFSNYPQGNDLIVGESGQCRGIKAPKYKGKKISDEAIKMAKDYDPSRLMNMQKQQQQNSSTMKSKTMEYRDTLQGIKNTPSMDTLEQQYTDMTVFDSQNKTNLIIWAVISASILAIIMIRK